MTIGQRISALRKQSHLSQEDLGAQLGVSRQSIYKWENDVSIPEIDKLIALCKLFSVSVGWLLGVEDAPEQSSAASEPAAQSDELTEQQLKLVEEITARYIAAQPKAQNISKRKYIPIAGAVILLLAAFTLFHLNSKLNDLKYQYNNLQIELSNIQSNVNNSIYGISNRVEEILKSQNNLTASYNTEFLSTNLAENTVTFSLHAVPKTYISGMTAVFCATQAKSGETTEVPGILGQNQEFSAEVTCPLSDDIVLSVTFITGEKKENQHLDQYQGLYSETAPGVDLRSSDLIWTPCKNGKVSLKGQYFIVHNGDTAQASNAKNPPAEIKSVRVGLFKNQELISWTKPCEVPSNYSSSDDDSFYLLPALDFTIQKEDVLAVAAVILDEYDREYVQVGDYVVWDQERDELMWPQSGTWDYSSSPEDWSY